MGFDAHPLLLGAASNSETIGYFVSGKMDEARVWNVSLPQSVILSSMNTRLNGNEAGLVGYWGFEEGTGLAAADLTSNHNDGDLGVAAGMRPSWDATDGAPLVNEAGAASVTSAIDRGLN